MTNLAAFDQYGRAAFQDLIDAAMLEQKPNHQIVRAYQAEGAN